ncbi:hypothetical protein [Hyphomicrobium sp.]|uniref:hypothetical protein n=1 Tax=Hyphomicrobium sp. TaxID=82 RepID=UPI002D79498C|nr:hypothetical protein [Hyphomicrobium sp.]HET6388688.1 hypothetical protein [Hyphomicrobium sp.]
MLRMLALVVSLGGSALSLLPASAHADGFAAREEARFYYGAVVTLEHGVRVYRPLPPDVSDDYGYGAVLFTSNGRYAAPAADRAYEWRPGFYRILARGERH